jgi:hypothetical protein
MVENKNTKHEILLGLTTTPASDWKGKVEEMKKFGIKRIALFPTFLEVNRRKELYDLLDTINGLQIPHVHLREEDMEEWEMEWFEKHGTEFYNTHMGEHSNEALAPYLGKIFVENHENKSIPEENLKEHAGICLDFQHWEKAKKRYPGVAKKTEEYANIYKIGCCHMSALPSWKNNLWRMIKGVGGHYMISFDEMDYVKNYADYFPKYLSIELENNFEQQLEVKKYLEKLLNI